ncbi:MAG: hypothetical protein COA84_08375 [Robiginitomaculum sp.]|nr:MAG: hypothetical protein COA84_08375 [Robiginitomaculum sp.]
MKAFFISLGILCLCWLPSTANARDIDVDLELILAVDISYSVDEGEARKQRNGYVTALQSAEVVDAIRSGPHGRIAVVYVEWADSAMQRIVAPWTIIQSEADATAFARKVHDAPFVQGHYTAIGSMVERSFTLFRANNANGLRRVIDISGDGPQNQGANLETARLRAADQDIVINGLPIISQSQDPWRPRVDVQIDQYYRNQVIVGPGAFVVPAHDFDDFKKAVLRKMVLEIADNTPYSNVGNGMRP